MADAVTSQTILDTPSKLVMKFTNTSDGTGESAVKKVDVSAFTAGQGGPHSDTSAATCTEVTIDKIWFNNSGMTAKLLWDASSDVEAIHLKDGDGYYDFSDFGGLRNNASSPTGDIMLTTVSHSSGDFYCVVLEMTKLS